MQAKLPIGIITMAYGPDRYIRQAETLARSIRRNMPGMPIALVTDRSRASDLFDHIVAMAPVERAGTVHKVRMNDYTPFDETLFIDSDSIVVKGFDEQLAEIRAFDFSPIVVNYLKAGDKDLWLDDVGAALAAVGGTAFPKFNGGVYFFRKSAMANKVFAMARELIDTGKAFGVRDFDASGPGDETVIGLALAALHPEPLYRDRTPLMRTPLNSTGRIVMDPFTGSSGFVKNGRAVSPAICHFCGPWIDHPTYRIAEIGLERGAPLVGLERAWQMAQFGARFRWKMAQARRKGV